MDIAELVLKRWDVVITPMNIPFDTSEGVRKFDFFSLRGRRGKGVVTMSTGIIDGRTRQHVHATFEYFKNEFIGHEKLQAYLEDGRLKRAYIFCKMCEEPFLLRHWHENGCSLCLVQYAHSP